MRPGDDRPDSQYAPGPCAGWVIGVAPADFWREQHPVPVWPITIQRSDRDYSPVLMIEAPDDVIVHLIGDDGERLP